MNFVKNEENKNLQNQIDELKEQLSHQKTSQNNALLTSVATDDISSNSLGFQFKGSVFSPNHFDSFTLICVLVIIMLIRLIFKKKKENKNPVNDFV